MEIRASRRAIRFVRKRGGVLYVWAGADGLLSHALEKPSEIEFRRLRAPGFALFLQKGLILGEWVGIERSPLPPWRLIIGFQLMGVVGDGGSGGPAQG